MPKFQLSGVLSIKYKKKGNSVLVSKLKNQGFVNTFHPDLVLAENYFYKQSELFLQNLKIEDESADYGASEFTIMNRMIKFRVGKITPTKVGQFVTFWKRIGKGQIAPYELTDSFDVLVVSVRHKSYLGQFIFPKNVLCEKGIVSSSGKEGKRAMRIYPPWDKADNSQAKKTQAWQLPYFIQFTEDHFDTLRLKYLLGIAKNLSS